MDYQELNGIWQGVFRYDYLYPREFRNIKEAFTLDLEFEGAHFKGSCKDRFTETQFSSPATIEGSFTDKHISFIKKYPALLALDEYGQSVVLPEEPSYNIYYTGTYHKRFFSGAVRFIGDWRIVGIPIGQLDGPEEVLGSGTWTMNR